MAKNIYPKKPSIPKIKIMKHGSGYEVYDGRTKIQATTTLDRAISSVKKEEKEYKNKLSYWLKNRKYK